MNEVLEIPCETHTQRERHFKCPFLFNTLLERYAAPNTETESLTVQKILVAIESKRRRVSYYL